MNSENVRLPNYQKAQLQSFSIFSKFVHPLVFAESFKPSLHVLSTHFYVSPNLVAVPTVSILITLVTQLLRSNLSITFTYLSQGSSCIKAYRNLFYVFWFLPCSFIQLKIFSWFSEMPFPTDASNWKQKNIYNLLYYMLIYLIKNWIIGWFNPSVLIGSAIMAYEPLYHALQIW